MVRTIRRSRLWLPWLAALALVVLSGCAPAPAPTAPPPPAQPLPEVPAADLAEAIRFRSSFGLQSDEEYIRTVAADPSSAVGRDLFGVPLTIDEVAELERRQRLADGVIPVIVEYGEELPGAFGAIRIDQERGGIIVVGMVGDPEVHLAALRDVLGPEPLVEVVPVEYSIAQLNALRERIHQDDRQWLAAIPARIISLGADPFAEKVIIGVSSPHPDAVAIIREHYGDPPWLAVESDGTGVELLPVGRVELTVLDVDGEAARDIGCIFKPDWGGDAIVMATNAAGVCEGDVPATGYWVRLVSGTGQGSILSVVRAVVAEGATTRTEVRLPR